MSYDLQIWSVLAVGQTSLRPGLDWTESSFGWAHQARDWQIVVSCSDEVIPEDIPDGIAPLLPGIQFLTQINLEGKASKSSQSVALGVAKEIARHSKGLVFDPQLSLITTPAGTKRIVPFKRSERLSVLQLSWWFMDSPLETAEGRERLLGLLEQQLPEALPNRYGLWEPPQHKFAVTGRGHFLEFLSNHLREGIVWETRRPIKWVSASFPEPRGAYWQGFRCNQFEIQVEHDLLQQPGWELHLRRFWRSASALIRPFYGEVRLLRGQSADGYVSASDISREECPVISWWWRGIPTGLGCAAVLGEPYTKLWPAFVGAAEVSERLAFVENSDWVSGGNALPGLSNVPKDIASSPFISMDYTDESYPQTWPFEYPFKPRK
jgi:hypothetical protein